MENTQKFWSGVAEKYATNPIKDMDAYTYTLERTRSYLGADDKVLELGCGSGSTAMLLAPNVREYHATDLAEGMITVGQRKAQEDEVASLKLSVADIAEATSFGPFDTVLAFNLLHLVQDLDQALERISKAVKPGGLFISKTTCKSDGFRGRFILGAMMAAVSVMQLFGKAPYVNIGSIRDLEAKIVAQGFQIIETGNYPLSPPNRYIVARKL